LWSIAVSPRSNEFGEAFARVLAVALAGVEAMRSEGQIPFPIHVPSG
jgi:hypothetical protein